MVHRGFNKFRILWISPLFFRMIHCSRFKLSEYFKVQNFRIKNKTELQWIPKTFRLEGTSNISSKKLNVSSFIMIISTSVKPLICFQDVGNENFLDSLLSYVNQPAFNVPDLNTNSNSNSLQQRYFARNGLKGIWRRKIISWKIQI